MASSTVSAQTAPHRQGSSSSPSINDDLRDLSINDGTHNLHDPPSEAKPYGPDPPPQLDAAPQSQPQIDRNMTDHEAVDCNQSFAASNPSQPDDLRNDQNIPSIDNAENVQNVQDHQNEQAPSATMQSVVTDPVIPDPAPLTLSGEITNGQHQTECVSSSEDENLFDMVIPSALDADTMSTMSHLPGISDAAAATAQSTAENENNSMPQHDGNSEAVAVLTLDDEPKEPDPPSNALNESNPSELSNPMKSSNESNPSNPSNPTEPTRPTVLPQPPATETMPLSMQNHEEADYGDLDLFGSDSGDINLDQNGDENVDPSAPKVVEPTNAANSTKSVNPTEPTQSVDPSVPEETEPNDSNLVHPAPLSVISTNTNTMASGSIFLEVTKTPLMLSVKKPSPFRSKIEVKKQTTENAESTKILPAPPEVPLVIDGNEQIGNVVDEDTNTGFSSWLNADNNTGDFGQLMASEPSKGNPQPLFAALDHDDDSDDSDSSEDEPLFGTGVLPGQIMPERGMEKNGGGDSEDELLFNDLNGLNGGNSNDSKSSTDFKHFLDKKT